MCGNMALSEKFIVDQKCERYAQIYNNVHFNAKRKKLKKKLLSKTKQNKKKTFNTWTILSMLQKGKTNNP